MVKSQKEENQILRRKKAENRIDEPELSVEVEKEDQQPMAAPKEDREVKTVQRLLKGGAKKAMNVWFDVDTHKDLGRIKLEHDIDMREIAYIAIRKFLDDYMKDGKLNEKGINYLEKKLKELNGF